MGIFADFAAGTVRISDENIAKIKEARDAILVALPLTPTISDLQVAFGLLFWGSEVLFVDLSKFYFAMKWYSRRLSATASLPKRAQANASAGTLWSSARRQLIEWFDILVTNTPVHPSQTYTTSSFTLWTDSSSSGYGSVLLNRVTGAVLWDMGKWEKDTLFHHINVKELRALSIALTRWKETIGVSPVSILVDNSTMRFAIRKRFSGSSSLNAGLSEVLPKLAAMAVVSIAHVSSADNIADLPSRGSPPDSSAVSAWTQRAFG